MKEEPKVEGAAGEEAIEDPLLSDCLSEMAKVYRDDPMKAVRGQAFIKLLHGYLGSALEARLTPWAKRRGIKIVYEAKVLGSHKPKDVDVALVDPENGPLMLIGVRSQMSSVGKNALNYYEGIVGECISLQDRFPLATHGYLYLMPEKPIKEDRETEVIDHERWARFYEGISGRSGPAYDKLRGIYDEFGYMVVDFDEEPPKLREDLIAHATELDLSIGTFVDRLITTFNDRMLFWDVLTEAS
jgi:hypothetical protein